jgi:hypothetical protein
LVLARCENIGLFSDLLVQFKGVVPCTGIQIKQIFLVIEFKMLVDEICETPGPSVINVQVPQERKLFPSFCHTFI